jgi:outer membrane protein TolC
MKKTVSCLLALALLLTPLSFAADEQAEPAEEPAITLVTYEDLTELLIGHSDVYKAKLRAVHSIQLQVWEAMDQHKVAVALPLREGGSTAINLQGTIVTLNERLAEETAVLEEYALKNTFAAQKLYWAHYINAENLSVAQRALEATERDLPAQQRKRQLGLISQTALEAYEKTVKTAKDSVKTAQKAVDDNLKQLADYLGLEGEIALDGMPEIDLTRVTERDLESDRKAYRESAPAVVAAIKALDSASNAAKSNNSYANSYAATAAREDLAAAKETAFAEFDDVYQTLLDSYEEYATSQVVPDAETALNKAKTQWGKGLISQNELAKVQRAYDDAVSNAETQRIRLWLALLEYEYNLIKWDLLVL